MCGFGLPWSATSLASSLPRYSTPSPSPSLSHDLERLIQVQHFRIAISPSSSCWPDLPLLLALKIPYILIVTLSPGDLSGSQGQFIHFEIPTWDQLTEGWSTLFETLMVCKEGLRYYHGCVTVLKLVSSLCLHKLHQHTRHFDSEGSSAKYSKYCEYPTGSNVLAVGEVCATLAWQRSLGIETSCMLTKFVQTKTANKF